MAERETFGGILQARFSSAGGDRSKNCVATLLTDEVLLTAKHCIDFDVYGATLASEVVTAEVVFDKVLLHPSLDVALLWAPAKTLDMFSAHWLSLTALAPLPAVGDLVQLVGFEDPSQVGTGRMVFAVEQVTSVGGTTVEVSANGFGGPCPGDSGAPLLARDSHGAVAIVGLLSSGHVSCRGSDEYTLWDSTAWFDDFVDYDSEPLNCGLVTSEGACVNSTATYCAQDEVVVEHCSPTSPCGWNEGAGGYRCTPEGDDPCNGVDAFGVCEGAIAVRCDKGGLTHTDCGYCAGGQCVRSPSTGNVACYLP